MTPLIKFNECIKLNIKMHFCIAKKLDALGCFRVLNLLLKCIIFGFWGIVHFKGQSVVTPSNHRLFSSKKCPIYMLGLFLLLNIRDNIAPAMLKSF